MPMHMHFNHVSWPSKRMIHVSIVKSIKQVAIRPVLTIALLRKFTKSVIDQEASIDKEGFNRMK